MIIRGSTIAFLFSLFLIIQAKKYSEDGVKDYDEWREFQEFREWKKLKSLKEKELISNKDNEETNKNRVSIPEEDVGLVKNVEKVKNKDYEKTKERGDKSNEKNEENQRWKDKKRDYKKHKDLYKKKDYEGLTQDQQNPMNDDPPPVNEYALMARYIVNQANWTSVATISSRKDIKSFPSANVISFSDGLLKNGSGIPYMYLTPLDFTAQDIFKDNRASLMMTLAQGTYCGKKNYDPMDPRCARVILSGKIKSIKNGSAELEVAKKAVFSRHPWLEDMPTNHNFFFAKLKIATIAMLDTFGGPKYITVQDYLHPPKSNLTTDFPRIKLQKSGDIKSPKSASDVADPEVLLL